MSVVRRVLAQEGILSVVGEPFYRTVAYALNTRRRRFQNPDSLLPQFLGFFDDCVRFLGSATVDREQRDALPFARRANIPYIPYPVRPWMAPKNMPEGCQNEPAWAEDVYVQEGQPLLALRPRREAVAEAALMDVAPAPGSAGRGG